MGSVRGFLIVLGHTGVRAPRRSRSQEAGTPRGAGRLKGGSGAAGSAHLTMAEQGRRLAVLDAERVEVEAFEVPEPGPGQVLVRVSRSQVSAGSEKGRFRGAFNPSGHTSRPPGYTAVGRIQSVGPGVEDFSVGDRVFAMGRHSSHLIVDAAPNVDSTLRFDEGQFPGRLAQRIESEITDEQACFSRLGDVALHGVRRAELQPDESVVVFGQGVVGQLIVGVCRVAGGHPIVAVDLDAERLNLSRESGATHTVDASSTDAVEEATRITGGAQCVFHANREAQTLDDCVRSAGYLGKVVLVGATGGEARMRLGPILSREIDIRGSQWTDDSVHKYYPWSSARDRAAVMRMIESGNLKVDHLISHVAKPEEADDLYRLIVDGTRGWMGIFFDWDE